MNIKSIFVISLFGLTSFGFVTGASAVEKTRAEVRQELIDAQKSGLNFTTGAYYPEASPGFTEQVKRMKERANDDVGGTTMGTVQSTKQEKAVVTNECVGPRGYCDIYFGQ